MAKNNQTDLLENNTATNWVNRAKWVVVTLIVFVGVIANGYYASESILYRVLGLLLLAVIAGYIAYLTEQGKSFWILLKGAQKEIRKVIWPTQQETTSTSLIVIAITIVMSLILWGLDSFFGWLTSLLIG
jgi:preprotein translocase subunit SecE